MKRLTRVAQPPQYISYLDQIRQDKKNGADKQQLTDHAQAVTERYIAFSDALNEGRLHQLAPLAAPVELAAALRSCYGRNKGTLAIKDAIKTAQAPRLLKYCPMCGTTLPGTYDHYLPSIRFPELSVHPLNLVPCCATCNSRKGDNWLDTSGRRQYLNFYLDDVTRAPFLQVKLHQLDLVVGVGATFSLVRPTAMSDRLWELVQSHFMRLGLLKRYAECANDEIAEILASCAIYARHGGPDARQFLVNHASDATGVYGSNHWRAVLMASLAEADGLESWIDAVPIA